MVEGAVLVRSSAGLSDILSARLGAMAIAKPAAPPLLVTVGGPGGISVPASWDMPGAMEWAHRNGYRGVHLKEFEEFARSEALLLELPMISKSRFHAAPCFLCVASHLLDFSLGTLK